ncbi:plasmid recombination protein [Devosia sp. WQ 349]|uniref:plasmid recombination protein n=1 Tax=Devosia sp. WQ 349K1 TaxID=2800329 RepID=UPI001905EF9E|nr:plasmid recombination protein [Devosia sp. WQ 349K1]MBK1792942.1 plasmid recombination protein [Devosia sp. WQ 349K1]
MKTTPKKREVAPDNSEANKKAILGRLKHCNHVQANGQNRHDVRAGRQPKYVDPKRKELNDVLIEPLSGATLKEICNSRRAQRDLQKRAKKDGKVATTGLIAFGTEAQVWFEALDRNTQNRAFRAIAEAICSRCNTTLTGLIVHRDESAIHAHFQMPSYDIDGHPLTKTMTWRDYGRLQDLVAEIIFEFEPRIERGNRKFDRIAAGALPSDTINLSVKRLHGSLLTELDEGELELEGLHADRDEAQAELDTLRASVAALFAQHEKVKERILKLKEQETLTEQKAKNLRLYEGRLAKHAAEHEEATAKLRLAEASIEAQMAAVDRIREDAENQASETIADAIRQQETLLEGVQMIADGELSIDKGRWSAPGIPAEFGARLKPLLRYLRPIYDKLAELVAKLTREREALAKERVVVASERARAGEMLIQLETIREQLNAAQAAKVEQVREDLDLSP